MKFCLTTSPVQNPTLPFSQLATVVLIGCGLALSVSGQTTPPSRVGRVDTVQREQQRQVEMQMIEQALTTEGRAPRVKRYPPAVLDQIRSDFLQIQVADRKLVKATPTGNDLDLKLVGQLTEDIRKRSRRLKENLALPEPGKQQPGPAKAEVTREQLRTSLADLSKSIESFVSNPMFEHSKLFDQQLSDKAWKDLVAIIQLSGDIKRSSEQLRKHVDYRSAK